MTTHGDATDFARAIGVCDPAGAWCLIGGLAVNCFAEPVYTLDADLVLVSSALDQLAENLGQQGFSIERHQLSLKAQTPASDLRIQFTTDSRYQAFLPRAVDATVPGIAVKIACLEDHQGKLWAYSDPSRRFSKRKKDELDLIRLSEAWPTLRTMYPKDLLDQIDRG